MLLLCDWPDTLKTWKADMNRGSRKERKHLGLMFGMVGIRQDLVPLLKDFYVFKPGYPSISPFLKVIWLWILLVSVKLLYSNIYISIRITKWRCFCMLHSGCCLVLHSYYFLCNSLAVHINWEQKGNLASQFGQVVVSKPLKVYMIFLFAVVLMFVVFWGR